MSVGGGATVAASAVSCPLSEIALWASRISVVETGAKSSCEDRPDPVQSVRHRVTRNTVEQVAREVRKRIPSTGPKQWQRKGYCTSGTAQRTTANFRKATSVEPPRFTSRRTR